MTGKRIGTVDGFSLIEIMAALLVLAVAVIGASGYRYYAALDSRKANEQVAAARIGLLLCETWRGVKGESSYDPIAQLGSELAIVPSDYEYVDPYYAYTSEGFFLLGAYSVTVENTSYEAVLAWKDVSAGLRSLNVVVAWSPQGKSINADQYTTDPDSYKLFKLTTYVPN